MSIHLDGTETKFATQPCRCGHLRGEHRYEYTRGAHRYTACRSGKRGHCDEFEPKEVPDAAADLPAQPAPTVEPPPIEPAAAPAVDVAVEPAEPLDEATQAHFAGHDAGPPTEPAAFPVDLDTAGPADLLEAASSSGDQRAADLAAQVRVLLGDIRARLDALTAVQAAARRVAELEAELRAARGVLMAERNRIAEPKHDNAKVRAWAKANGMTCSPYGRPDKLVIAAYEAAHPNGGG